MLFEMSQSKPMHTGVGFMQTSPQLQKVMLVGCDWRISIRLVCLAVERWMSIESNYALTGNAENGCNWNMLLSGVIVSL